MHKDDKSFIYDLLFQGKIQATCNVEFCPETFGFHNPYNESQMKGAVVAIFRHPMNRIISAYLYNNEMMIPTGMPFGERYELFPFYLHPKFAFITISFFFFTCEICMLRHRYR